MFRDLYKSEEFFSWQQLDIGRGLCTWIMADSAFTFRPLQIWLCMLGRH